MAHKTYRTDEIVVHWDSTRCIHTAICLRALPQVFDVKARPWVDVGAADADAIEAAVRKCPTGALRAERLDGVTPPEEEAPTTIVPFPNGPLIIRGRVRVQAAQGGVICEEDRIALCRCGGSRNQPFCDNTHRKRKFKDTTPVVAQGRTHAQSPQDCGERHDPT